MPRRPERPDHADSTAAHDLRIVGGTHRGRKLRSTGDPRTRPMKNRVREAVFNLLGPDVVDSHAIDLFAGSGALGLEALSRGAAHATLLEKHFPTADLIRDNARALALDQRVTVLPADTFIHFRRRVELPAVSSPSSRWTVFCSPPFEFFVERQAEMVRLLTDLLAAAPPGSVLVVESDDRFDPAALPDAAGWRVREYPPARVALYRKGSAG